MRNGSGNGGLRMAELKPCPFCGSLMDGGNEDV